MNLLSKSIVLALAMVFSFGAAAKVSAQVPVNAVVVSVAQKVYMGSETVFLANGVLGFAFKNDGTAIMSDARTNPNDPKTMVRGTWQQNGNQVVVTFSDCVYTGQLDGNVIAGTLTFNNNPGQTFTFHITHAPGN